MNLTKIVDRCLKPHIIVFITAALSLLCWIYPNASIRRGFMVKEDLRGVSIFLISLWYILIIALSYFGFLIGNSIKRIKSIDSISNDLFYKIFSIMGILGVLFTYLSVLKSGLNIIDQLQNGFANQLKMALYNNYSMGILSFRYVSILSGAIALLNIIQYRKIRLWDAINVISLLLVAIISSRLSIMITVMVLVGLIVKNKVKLSVRLVGSSLILLFLLLTFLNYSRNMNYYLHYYNISNPFLMNISEIITYLGSPFQVSVGVGNNFGNITNNTTNVLNNILYYISPTFFRSFFDINLIQHDYYRAYVDIENNLTTNSAFADITDNVGMLSYSLISLSSFFYSFLVGHFRNYSSYLYLVSYIIIYCFAELWRIYLFSEGIIQMLILAIIVALVIGIIITTLLKPRQI